MGWRFRKSFRLFPGVRLNLSKSGISTTIGFSPFTVNVGRRGTYANVNLPGTGISLRQRMATPASYVPPFPLEPQPQLYSHPEAPGLPPLSIPVAPDPTKEEIRSASTHELSSEGLDGLRKLLAEAIEERWTLDTEIASGIRERDFKTAAYDAWANGFLMKRLRKARFALLEQEAQEAKDKLEELQEQRRLTTIATEIEIAKEIRPLFGRICDAFSAMAESQRVWDTLSTRQTNRAVERTTASATVQRQSVGFRLSQSDLLQCEWKVPYLENANGGDLVLYPGFILYQVSRKAFAVIDCRDVRIEISATNFIEEEGVPGDTQVVGRSWKYANKNGGPDRRFNDNFQIPVVVYAQLSLTSPTGLNERYLISNFKATESFVLAWQEFHKAISST